jgi:Acetyltransferase (GNAT) domain
VEDAYSRISARRIEVRARKMAPELAIAPLSHATTYKHHLLLLNKDPEALFRSFAKSSICQKVAKAAKDGVEIVEANSGGVDTCYRILAETRRRLSLPPMPFAFFAAMADVLWPAQMRMFIAMHHGQPVGCHIVLISRDLWISEHSGNSDHSTNGVNQLLYWETIRRAQACGAKAFSFGRTSAYNHGLLAYKRRWATVEEDVAEFVFPAERGSDSSAIVRSNPESSVAYTLLKWTVANAPMPVCKAIGRFCYRHLG